MFYLIGLGLGDAKDVTVKGLEIIRKCDRVYLESYTSILGVSADILEEFYGRKLVIADREMCENDASLILNESRDKDIALLVVGDPLSATTHTDLLLRAEKCCIPYQVVQNASIMNAVGCCGLQLYSFGETVSIPFWTDSWKPISFYDKIVSNFNRGLHTLCLLDIKIKEPTEESLTKKKKVYMDPKFMSVNDASKQLIEIVQSEKADKVFDENTTVVGVARVGSSSQKITVSTIQRMCHINLGPPLHSLIVPAKLLHPLEKEFLKLFEDLTEEM